MDSLKGKKDSRESLQDEILILIGFFTLFYHIWSQHEGYHHQERRRPDPHPWSSSCVSLISCSYPAGSSILIIHFHLASDHQNIWISIWWWLLTWSWLSFASDHNFPAGGQQEDSRISKTEKRGMMEMNLISGLLLLPSGVKNGREREREREKKKLREAQNVKWAIKCLKEKEERKEKREREVEEKNDDDVERTEKIMKRGSSHVRSYYEWMRSPFVSWNWTSLFSSNIFSSLFMYPLLDARILFIHKN